MWKRDVYNTLRIRQNNFIIITSKKRAYFMLETINFKMRFYTMFYKFINLKKKKKKNSFSLL